ncbi:uncharacterized protein RJT20DRAFT_148256 [Scheffersomyces xylosifermentans]|uniref:uncharacterized protein n=1 Tax=Scheffersomyces xylosifermentans TaxID=1304137 RepID=UPI00315CBD7C
MAGKTYFVSGATRGIGFQITKQFVLANPENVVVATARDPTGATALKELAASNKNLHIIQLDVTSDTSIESIDSQLSKITSSVDVFISNGAIADALGKVIDIPKKVWEDHYYTNTLGPVLVFQKLYKYLVKGTAKQAIFISTSASSITQFFPISVSAYGQSKAALNYTVKELSFEHGQEGFTVVAVHPGAVSTDMGNQAVKKMSEDDPELVKSLESLIITPEESGLKLKALFDGFQPKDNGLFYSYDGSELAF